MKLEAGKKYVLRNGVVVECLAVWFREYYGFQATVAISEENCPSRYTLDGHYYRSKGESDYNIVAEYKEPKKFKSWVNLNSDGSICWSWTKEAADASAEDTKAVRIECRKIEWEVPDNG